MKRIFFPFASLSSIVITAFVILAMGCQRELKDPGGNPNPPAPPPASGSTVNDNVKVNAGIRGMVIDENNRPVQGVTVTSGSNTTVTDRYGVFQFTNISLSKENGAVKVSKTGYFTATRTFPTVAGRIHNVRIKLIPKTNSGSFTGASGGTVTVGSGKLVMPANAVTDAGGNAYTGTVNVAMTWIDPTSADLPYVVPGDLRGITTSGEERGLETFGMLGVELTGSTGQALKVAAGKTAELTFPIPASLQAGAPATIDLWNFDETTNRWKQEGTATKSGSNYIANVSHFSFWNCDAPFPLVEVCMTIVNAHSSPLSNVTVRIKRPNNSYGYGITDSLGNLCGKLPRNESLTLEILGQCGNVVYTQPIGPFSANTSLGNITATIPGTSSLTITGTVTNCSNGNVTNGVAIIYTGNGHSYAVPITNGTFSHTIIRCDNTALNYTILGVDYTTVQQGVPVTGTATTGTVNAGTIQACGTSSAEFIEFLVDGVPLTYTSPPAEISTNDSISGPTSSFTVFAANINGQNTVNSFFSFGSNGTTGTGPLLQCRVSPTPASFLNVILTPNPTVNITTFGPPITGFVEGNFNVSMNSPNNTTPANVICTFKVRRN